MKEITGSIVILAGSMMLIAAEHFDSTLFWIIGGLMLLDGSFLVTVSVIFPKWFKRILESINTTSTNSSQPAT